jgi:glycosyltransferase involved in cell wall biosynthesis
MSGLSIVLPAYNEEENVEAAVEHISDVARRLEMDYEIILVNDGSSDRTGEIGRELEQRVPNFRLVEHYPNRGYGGALKAGFAAANKELIAFFPGDKQFDFGEIGSLLERLDEADIVSGYRANRQDSAMRKFFAFGWNTLMRLLFGYLCRDVDCGSMIDTEFLFKARLHGYRIADVPVTHLPRVAGEATGGNIRVIVKAFRDLVLFRLRLSRELRAERR